MVQVQVLFDYRSPFYCMCFLGQENNQSGTEGQKSVPSATHAKQQELLSKAQIIEQPFVLKDPPPEFEFICDPPSISALDL